MIPHRAILSASSLLQVSESPGLWVSGSPEESEVGSGGSEVGPEGSEVGPGGSDVGPSRDGDSETRRSGEVKKRRKLPCGIMGH